MLLEIKGKLVNAFVEPQFAELGLNELVTVQFYHYEKLKNFRKKLDGDLRFDQNAKFFPFTGYAHFSSIWFAAKPKSIELKDLFVEEDISPAPIAYKWIGIKHEVEDWEDESDAGEWQGEALPEDIKDLRYVQDISYDEFLVFPLYHLPESLAKQKLLRG